MAWWKKCLPNKNNVGICFFRRTSQKYELRTLSLVAAVDTRHRSKK